MRAIRLVAIVLGALLALLLGVLAFVIATFDGARLKTELAGMVLEKTGRTLRIDSDLALSFWPDLGIRVGKASLSESHGDTEFAAIDGARVSVAVLPLFSKRIVVNAVELNGARATLVKHKDGALNIDDLTSKKAPPDEKRAGAAAAAAPVRIDIASIKIADARVIWRDEATSRTTTLSGFYFSTGRIVGDTARQAYEVDGLSLGMRGESGADSIELKLNVPKLALADDEARTFRADSIEGSLGLASPRMPMKSLRLPLKGQLQAELARQTARGSLSTRFDDSNIALKFEAARFSPLTLGFDLDVDQLNVDKYLPPAKAGKKTETGAETGGKASESRIDLSALRSLNGIHGSARIGRLQVSNVKASDMKLQVRAADGRLDVAPHSMKLYDGTLAGALSLDADGNAVALRENLSGVSINPLLRDLADKDLIEGHGDVRFDISTRGDTVAAMKKALGGTVSLALRDGALMGINLAQSFRELKAVFSSKQDAVQQAKATDKTDFTEMTASFRISGGVARNDDLLAKSPFLRLGGAGDIDIAGGTMDYLAKASVVDTSGGQGGKELDHLRGVTVPVRVTGPFDKLSYKLEFGAIAEGALKAKVEEKKQELKQRAKEELIRGLFGK